MMRRLVKIGLVVSLAAFVFLGTVHPANASAITFLNDNWYEFQFGGPGTWADACVSCVPSSGGNSEFVGEAPWTFNASSSFTFAVVDAFLSVDQFEVYDFGSLIGTTSAPTAGASGISDPEIALLDSRFSRGFFDLGAGDHSITIKQIAGVSGAAYFRTAVPEPSTLLLLGSGLIGLVGLGRRKKIL